MNKHYSLVVRAAALVGIALIFRFALSDHAEAFGGFLDTRAAVLVFITPIFILLLFHREVLSWGEVFRRLMETRRQSNDELQQALAEATEPALGNYGASFLLKLSENHPDRFVRYAGSLYSARFPADEMAGLLAQQIESEDLYWQSIASVFGFLAKMAPYFGMLATVMGMVKLLQNMQDFTRISGGMALAMQGTLYGLISFTMVYSPMQKFISSVRELIYRRNQGVARWLLLIAQKADPALVREELRSQRFAQQRAPAKRQQDPVLSPKGVS